MKAILAYNFTLLLMIILISAESDLLEPCYCDGNRTDCSNRLLSAVPKTWLNCTVRIDLSHNQITSIGPQAFLGLTNLIYIDLSWNAISSLDGSAFVGLSGLLHLNLNENPLPYGSGLTVGVFAPLVKLKELYLFSDDCPTQPPDQYVQGLTTLETLAIVATENGRIGEKLGLLRSLDTLMLTSRQCKIQKLDKGDMRSIAHLPLRRLSLRSSGLHDFDPTFLTYFNRTLTKLDLSCNSLDNISSLSDALRTTKLDTLLLDAAADNFFSVDMSADFFSALSSTPLRVLSLAGNRHVQMDTFNANWASYRIPHLRFLRLDCNQLILNSNMDLERVIVAAIAIVYNLKVLDISGTFTLDGRQGARQHEILCHEHDPLFSNERQQWEDDQLLYPEPDFFESWMLAATYRLIVRNELTLPPGLTRLYATDLGGLLVKYSCHEKKIDFMSNLKIVDLSRGTLEDLQCNDSSLRSVTEFRMSKMGLKKFNPSYFSLSSMPMLRKLDLHGNHLGVFIMSRLGGGALFGLSGIEHLDLSANDITIVNPGFFYGLENVTIMNFSQNSICCWTASISTLKRLRVLDLSSNQLTAIGNFFTAEFDAHATKVPEFVVNLSSNSFVCSCRYIPFLEWLVDTRVVQGATYCLDQGMPKKLDVQFLLELRFRCTGMMKMILVLASLLFVLVPAVLYAYRWRIRYMYYRCRRLCRRNNRSWLVSAVGVYVSYHESDAGVAMKLRAYLATRVEKVTFVTRSSMALGQYELEQMAALIDDCSVSVILISPDGLNDPKFEFEFFMASEKGPYCILPIVTTESLELLCLPRALRKLLISNIYLRLPNCLRRNANGEIEGLDDSRLQKFLIIFESHLLNIIERQTIRRLRSMSNTARQQPDVFDNLANDEMRPLLA